ncbi:MAG: patatin-like phospholipase family protein [Acidimicrobiia bacterium]
MVTRALILAGGGMKVAFQAGVLQVWLDEAGIEFDLADGASGGTLNLAQWCQGRSGTEIADGWRTMRPLRAVQPDWPSWLALPLSRGLFRLDRFRTEDLHRWGLDWERIRTSERPATFNVWNVTRQRLEAIPHREMTEDLLVAAISLPTWFPPVRVGDDLYVDSVFATDANVEEAIRAGADELWVVWTVSRQGRWRPGPVNQYFSTIEAAANSRLDAVLARIEASNAAIAAGGTGEFGRPLRVRLLRAEVPVHYLLAFSGDRLAECVELGVATARAWCQREEVELGPATRSQVVRAEPVTLTFRERMAGHVGVGAADYAQGEARGRLDGSTLALRLSMQVDDLEAFLHDPAHEGTFEGTLDAPVFGGVRPCTGWFNLLPDLEPVLRKEMRYRVHFTDATGRPLTMTGVKEVFDDPGRDFWSDTTTFLTTIHRGHLEAGPVPADVEEVARGVLRLTVLDFARQLTTFRARGRGVVRGTAALVRFDRMFLGKLFEVYNADLVAPSPF